MFNLPYEITYILNRLSQAGFDAFLVGGAVRDNIMMKPVHDYDITTSATPAEIERVFSDCTVIDTGARHGTVTVLVGEYPVEVTVFRCESSYSDGRHPDSVSFSASLYEDLKRRDFTINAIAYSKAGGYTDPYGGIKDIEKKLIRCVGDPDERFAEDRLRILRAIRFSSVLGFRIEERTKSAIHRLGAGIGAVSNERVFAELCRLLCGEGVKSALTEYPDVIFNIIPELAVSLGYNQNNPNHCYTLYEHTVNCVSYVEPLLHLRLAALLHDSGKPACMTTDDAGISHFHGHQLKSEEIARNVFRRLHVANALTESVCLIIRYHDVRLKPTDRIAVKRLASKIGIKQLKDVLKMQKADTLSQSPKYYYRLNNLNKLQDIVADIEEKGLALNIRDLAVNGNDIISLGISEGRQIGAILRVVLDDVISERVPNEKEALEAHIIKITSKGCLQ